MADFASAHHVASLKPVIAQGIPMLSLLISNACTAVMSVGISWYISHRGMAGVKIDMANAKNELAKLTGNVPAV